MKKQDAITGGLSIICWEKCKYYYNRAEKESCNDDNGAKQQKATVNTNIFRTDSFINL